MKYLIINTKNNFSDEKLVKYIDSVQKLSFDNIKVIVCVLENQLNLLKGSNLIKGSQNFNNIDLLKEENVKYALCGHSSVRMQGKTNEDIIKDICNLQANDIIPILFVGENNVNEDPIVTLKNQLEEIISNSKINSNLIIAYEPVWSIGTGDVASVNHIKEILAEIKDYLKNTNITNSPILYGGSINSELILEYNQIKNIDGFVSSTSAVDSNHLINMITNMKG